VEQLECRSVKLGVMPYGPAYGQRSIEIVLESKSDNFRSWTHEDVRSVPCYEDFITKVREAEIEGMYTKAIDSTQSVFLLFRGGSIERTEHAEEFNAFVKAVTGDCIDLAKRILKDDPAALIKGQVKPPFMIFFGQPLTFTATRDFYQHFNVVLPQIDFRAPLSNVSQIALQEMLNHQNSVCLALVNQSHQLESFYPQMNVIRKTVVVDTTDEMDESRLIYSECVKKNYRYVRYYSGSWSAAVTIE
jgi:hypothetical protein